MLSKHYRLIFHRVRSLSFVLSFLIADEIQKQLWDSLTSSLVEVNLQAPAQTRHLTCGDTWTRQRPLAFCYDLYGRPLLTWETIRKRGVAGELARGRGLEPPSKERRWVKMSRVSRTKLASWRTAWFSCHNRNFTSVFSADLSLFENVIDLNRCYNLHKISVSQWVIINWVVYKHLLW